MEQAEFNAIFAWKRIPSHLRGGLARYVLFGIPNGSFVTAVLEGDLFRAYRTGTPGAIAGIGAIVHWFLGYAPSLLGEESVRKHIELGRRTAAAGPPLAKIFEFDDEMTFMLHEMEQDAWK
jgi:hypothetical protein